MAAVASNFLSLQQFNELYEGEKPYYEYWFGEAIQKPMATFLHGIVQMVLGMMLMTRGWKVASEVRLKLSAVAHPVPDLIADVDLADDPVAKSYPTKPFTLCIEILSPGDDLRRTFQKGAHYLDWGIRHVWIIDPMQRKAYSMSLERPEPVELTLQDSLVAPPGQPIPLAELFEQVDRVRA
jgi:Uma2 family endonuclease